MENQVKKNLSDKEITNYTATLWKYKAVPSKNSVPEPAPEYLHENHTIGKFRVTAARVRGKKHKHDGSNCDDWFETDNINGIFVSIVSDGAGSKKFSRIGSATACKAARYFLKIHLEKLFKTSPNFLSDLSRDMTDFTFSDAARLLANIVQDSILAAREAIVTAYESRRNYERYINVVGRSLQLSDFSCTLLLTVAVPLPEIGETLILSCQIGDGITAAINTKETFDKAVTLLGVPDSGKFSGETDFLTNSKFAIKENLINRTKLSRKSIDLILSMTDGVADDYDPNELHMRRLYFDLLINHILPLPKNASYSKEIEVPEPRAYPKQNGSKNPEFVPIQYTCDLCEMNNLTLNQIWENREPLYAMADKISFNEHTNTSSRLQEWLDNYTVRGSFDDRTLVIFFKEGDDDEY